MKVPRGIVESLESSGKSLTVSVGCCPNKISPFPDRLRFIKPNDLSEKYTLRMWDIKMFDRTGGLLHLEYDFVRTRHQLRWMVDNKFKYFGIYK
jgi:hypothetical protein